MLLESSPSPFMWYFYKTLLVFFILQEENSDFVLKQPTYSCVLVLYYPSTTKNTKHTQNILITFHPIDLSCLHRWDGDLFS